VSQDGSFAASEDSDSFDFQIVISCNNTGKSTFVFEDLTAAAVFSYVNVLSSRPSLSWEGAGVNLFALAGSVLTVRYAAIFGSPVTYLAYGGDLTLVSVVTDLPPVVPVLSASFAAVKCDFQHKLKTVKLKGFKQLCAEEILEVGRTYSPTKPKFDFGSEGSNGIVTFLGIAGVSAVLMFVYYMFIKKPDNYERLGDIGSVQLES
jgi:hypothetical protein